LYTVRKKAGKPDRKPHPLPYGLRIHTETSSRRTLMIMLGNLREIVDNYELTVLLNETGIEELGLIASILAQG
jgi:hypothetical protein